MLEKSWHDFVHVGEDGRIVGRTFYDWATEFGIPHHDHSASGSEIESHANGPTYEGDLSNENSGDLIAVNLTAGQTYTWSYRGTADGVLDPWLRLIGTDGVTLITEDDDGGFGRTSQITYTATATGTYYLNATSWYQIDPTAPDYQDNGDYTIVQWSPQAGHDAGSTIATAGTIEVGTNYEYLEVDNDLDYYAVQLTAGMYYTFTYNGGVASEPVNPGESIGVLGLYNSAGASVVGLTVNTAGELGISYYAATGGTYYLRAQAYSDFIGGVQFGGYTIDVLEQSLDELSPLEALNWDSADNIDTIDENGAAPGGQVAYVYFAAAGENFGETAPNGTPMVTLGWQPHEIAAVMSALGEYTPITGIEYRVTTDVNQAEFRMLTTAIPSGTPGAYGARFYPQDPAYGTQQGIGTFNVNSGGWAAFPQSLEPGGYSYAVILHEFGHAHGIAHPHDRGGGSEIMVGVTATTGSYGVFNLNQGVYTVMSYNDAWQFHPDGPSSFTVAGIDNGWSQTLGAFDIAVLQARYGVHAHNTGNNVYALTDVVDDASYRTIWDTGGTDTISYSGALNAQIDLTAATLDYTATGGGVVSFLYNLPTTTPASAEIKGGYTIANGVVIENATGGSGNDILIGNNVANVLTGNAGDDFLMGGAGGDTLNGGAGFDTASYRTSNVGVNASLQGSLSGGHAQGDKFISIEALEGSEHNDNLGGSNVNDTIRGLGGNDLIESGNGNDTVDGGAGNDTLKGGNGMDTLLGGDGDDVLEGGNDNDSLSGGAGNDRLDAGNGSDSLNGGAGNDRLDAGNGDDALNGGGGDDRLDGGNGVDRYIFTDAGTDTIVGYQRGEDIDLSGLAVTIDDVTIFNNRIFVDLDGDQDLTIMFNTSGFLTADLIFADPSAATFAALGSDNGLATRGDYLI